MRQLHATEVGRQVAISGLLPETASFLTQYMVRRGNELCELLPLAEGEQGERARLDFCLVYACLASPEFSDSRQTRFIPWGFGELVANSQAEANQPLLARQAWQAYRPAANGAALIIEWLDGVEISSLEGRFPEVRAGAIQALAREVAWCLWGLYSILAAATAAALTKEERSKAFASLSGEAITDLRRLLPAIRLLIWRLNVGLPLNALWLSEIQRADGSPLLRRREILALLAAGLTSFDGLLRRNNWQQLIQALRAAGVSDAHAKAAELASGVRGWRTTFRTRQKERQKRRINETDHQLLDDFYEARGKRFQDVFEDLMTRCGIEYTLYDDGRRPGAFDYLLRRPNGKDVVLECKSKEGISLVALGEAREVLASSQQYSYIDNPCVTLCQPGVNPDVLPQIQDCVRLSIVDSQDIAEACVLLLQKRLSEGNFFDWLTEPGQPTVETVLSRLEQ